MAIDAISVIVGITIGVLVTLLMRRGILMYKHMGSVLLSEINVGSDSDVYPYSLRIYVKARSPQYSKEENMRSLLHFGGLLNDLVEHARKEYPNIRPVGGSVEMMSNVLATWGSGDGTDEQV